MSRSIWKGPFSDLKRIKSVSTVDGDKSIHHAQGEDDRSTYSWTPSPLSLSLPTGLAQGLTKGLAGELTVVTAINHKKATIINVWSRRSQILPAQADKKFLVHNGQRFINVKCTQSMCSRKYGEFAVTRKKPSHKLNKRKQLHKNVR